VGFSWGVTVGVLSGRQIIDGFVLRKKRCLAPEWSWIMTGAPQRLLTQTQGNLLKDWASPRSPLVTRGSRTLCDQYRFPIHFGPCGYPQEPLCCLSCRGGIRHVLTAPTKHDRTRKGFHLLDLHSTNQSSLFREPLSGITNHTEVSVSSCIQQEWAIHPAKIAP
jgi:hypothetical protein